MIKSMIRRKDCLVALLLMVSGILNAQETEIQYLSGKDKDHTVSWEFLCTNGMNSGKWSRIPVPSNWELQGFGSYLYGNVNRKADEKGIYKYEFSVSREWKKKTVNIVFEGSMTDTEVKINGKSAGPVHQGAFYKFSYDISELLNFGEKNLLEVTVSKESSNESVNRAERISDFWVFGGIFRPVYLEALPKQYIRRVAIDAKADGSFYMEAYTGGKGSADEIIAAVLDSEGTIIGEAIRSKIIPGAERTVLKGSFNNIQTWNPEFPHMYRVEVNLVKGKKAIHQITEKFGFRTVEIKESDGIYVNGKKIMFRGVCRHTFWPSSGRASSKQLAIDDISLMKDMNMNAVRMSHYPPDEYFLDACDSMGMFVLDELAGWQKYYDTPTAQRLVRQMVERDVNHPSVVLWDNGNEGGFNKDVRGDYSLYDPQKRTVIEPWSVINGTNTKHYPGYRYVENVLSNNKEIYFPTEFLHGLNDGGLGAGLEDYWNLMRSNPLAAGGFLWVFADEGVERRDRNDSIDYAGNRAPDGILGPYHQKEGSFYTIKEIWAPVHFSEEKLTPGFNGIFHVENRFLYTNLNLCRFEYRLLRFGKGFPIEEEESETGRISSPDAVPGSVSLMSPDFPSGWRDYDVLYITAWDQYGRQINTWSWKLKDAGYFVEGLVNPKGGNVSSSVSGGALNISSGQSEISFDLNSGNITKVKTGEKKISVKTGNLFTGFSRQAKEVRHFPENENYVVEVKYDSSAYARWTVMKGGWIELDYGYDLRGSYDYAGVSLSYPEELVTGADLLGNGPYRVWKNRMKGVNFGLYKKDYNNTVTGQSWDYPEFKGYYSDFCAAVIYTREAPIYIVSATDDIFFHLFTPATATNLKGVSGGVTPSFPEGNISFLNGISPIGTKFSQPSQEGPQGEKNHFDGHYSGRIFLKFGNQ